MDNSPPIQPPLERKELLDAIDCEIAHRESVLSRHGISTWGVIAAIGALLWAAATEALSTHHNWTHVCLILLAGNWLLAFVTSPWLKALGFGNSKALAGRSLQEAILRFGLEADSFGYLVAHTVLLIIVAVYVGLKGFLLLSITSCAIYSVGLLVLGVCWMLWNVRMPLRTRVRAQKSKGRLRAAILTRALLIVVALVPVEAVWSVWPVEAPDARLGLILAALASLWGLSITLIRPPTATASLRDLRSQLAFGEVGVEEARMKAQSILRGSPDERYLTTKADDVAAEWEEYKRLCNSLNDRMDQVVVLADRLRAGSNDQVSVRQTASEFRTLHRKMRDEFRDTDERMATAVRLRRELGVRAEVAKIFLSLTPDFVNSVLKRVDDLGREALIPRQKFADRAKQFKGALDLLYGSQKGVTLPRSLTLSDAYLAFFRD